MIKIMFRLGVPRLLVTINKMDMIDFDQGKFETICDEFTQFAGKLGIKDVRFVPVSALRGDNIVQRSKNIPWYKGETVLEYLEHVYISGDRNLVDFRLPIQCVIRGQGTYRTYAGRIASGSIRVGEEVLVLPALKKTTISKIENFDAPESGLEEASAPQSVSVCLADEVDMARGCMLVRPNNVPNLKTTFEAMVVWMSETPLNLSQHYLVRHTTAESKAYVDKISYSIDVESLNRTETQTLRLNEIGRLTINTAKPLALDVYQNNRATGNFILIDPQTFATLGAGMVIERRSEEPRTKSGTPLNLHFEDSLVTRAERRLRSNFAPKTIWLTGLSGAGKSTIAKAIERKLFDLGISVYRLDGDNLRSGLNSNLGFSKEDRTENLRRAAEVAQLMNDAGLMVVAAFISPHQADREIIKKVVGPENFIHIYLSTPLEVCESRDPHGLYKKSRSGEVKNFTGVSSPFEAPADHNLIIDTSNSTIEQSVETIFALIQN